VDDTEVFVLLCVQPQVAIVCLGTFLVLPGPAQNFIVDYFVAGMTGAFMLGMAYLESIG
jgi:hypothetical protein